VGAGDRADDVGCVTAQLPLHFQIELRRTTWIVYPLPARTAAVPVTSVMFWWVAYNPRDVRQSGTTHSFDADMTVIFGR
jgi:hypothetical protein